MGKILAATGSRAVLPQHREIRDRRSACGGSRHAGDGALPGKPVAATGGSPVERSLLRCSSFSSWRKAPAEQAPLYRQTAARFEETVAPAGAVTDSRQSLPTVIPAKAGIQGLSRGGSRRWVPASAGTTGVGLLRKESLISGYSWEGRERGESPSPRAAPICRAELAPLLFVQFVGKAPAEQAPLYRQTAARFEETVAPAGAVTDSRQPLPAVIPANAGIQGLVRTAPKGRMPAFAEMTVLCAFSGRSSVPARS